MKINIVNISLTYFRALETVELKLKDILKV